MQILQLLGGEKGADLTKKGADLTTFLVTQKRCRFDNEPQKSMGGFVIDIWEKSNFFGSIGSQKEVKNAIFLRGGL